METQAKLDEFISEEFENDIRSGRQTLGPLYAVERLQGIKITLQNKFMLCRTQINKELSNWIAKPVRSHNQVMEYRERLELLLSMKERANGYKFKSRRPQSMWSTRRLRVNAKYHLVRSKRVSTWQDSCLR